MKLETLYKRAKTGKIQYWKVSTLHNTIFKESGSLGTLKPIKHEEICAAKNIGKSNETTPELQAESQAESDWQKKRDEGYKSLSDLGITTPGNHHVFECGSTGYGTLEAALENELPQFNTDASGNVKPMLAKAVDWKKVKYPCLVQPKLDGVRCLMIVTYADDMAITFLSRSGKEYTTLNHIKADVMIAENTIQKDFILDGEVYSDELSFQEIIAAVKKQRPDSLKLKFRAYDVVNDMHQDNRWSETVRIVDKISSPLVWPVSTFTLNNKAAIKEQHDKWVAEGYEGAMIRHMNGKYGQGQRSSDLLKVKEFDETEFAFKNFEFGQRGVEDLIAVLWTSDGEKEFRAKMIGTKAEKEKLYKLNDSSEGKSMTVKHFGYTDDGLPRFPIGKSFRDYE